MKNISNELLFTSLFKAKTEEEVERIIDKYPDVFNNDNWFPLGGSESMFGIVRNQQSNPIAALVEKVTNSIDAILTKKCLEKKIQPDSIDAPQSMEEAVHLFYPDYKNWDLREYRRKQAEDIQIIADGPTRDTSVIIYDNGEGQHPKDFESTFLSLVKGNKINIQFVQGKYNMGGSGALVFCGKKRFQLIASKRFDGSGNLGFTLIRQRKICASNLNRRSSHFEYLKLNNQIPNFPITDLDLNLYGRKFVTGTIIKMYSYQFPSGYSGFAQDLNQSLNEYLFEPILPILTVDKKERYPNNKVLELDLFGLKRRLEENQSDYIETYFSEEYLDQLFGKAKVTCYVFKPQINKYDVRKSREIIRERFFKNNMSVMFSINGQVHGYYTSEFITRTLKFNLLKDYLLIHVDCTNMDPDFREELFMASRDRLKQGDEANKLRDYLGKKLRKSQLDSIHKNRKDNIGLESEDTTELIKSFARNLPKNSDLFNLLQNTLKLDEKHKEIKHTERISHKPKVEVKPFLPKRYPTLFQLRNKKEGVNVIVLPKNGEKVIKFDTDVDNDYFDRTESPGDLEISLLQFKRNTETGGTLIGKKDDISIVLNIVKSSPNQGIIKLSIEPSEEVKVGDEIEIKASLTAPGENLEEIVVIKIADREVPKEKTPQKEELDDYIGLPELHKLKKVDWKNLESNGIEMGYDIVMCPISDGDQLQKIYINLDSTVFLNYRSKLKGEEQILAAEKKYISSVYFYALFLYMITKKKKYSILQENEMKNETVAIDEYIKELFSNCYSEFLLNFGMEQLIGALED